MFSLLILTGLDWEREFCLMRCGSSGGFQIPLEALKAQYTRETRRIEDTRRGRVEREGGLVVNCVFVCLSAQGSAPFRDAPDRERKRRAAKREPENPSKNRRAIRIVQSVPRAFQSKACGEVCVDDLHLGFHIYVPLFFVKTNELTVVLVRDFWERNRYGRR